MNIIGISRSKGFPVDRQYEYLRASTKKIVFTNEDSTRMQRECSDSLRNVPPISDLKNTIIYIQPDQSLTIPCNELNPPCR